MGNKIKLTFLGTAGAIPTAKRNHTAILLDYQGEHILIDCGEGTQRQFRKARINLCKTTKILLTHKHGDHVFGLPGLLSTLNLSEYNKTLYIYGPKGIKKFLGDFLDLANVERKFKVQIKEISGKFFETNDFYLEASSMTHGVPCNAYNFVIKDKLRIDKKKLSKSKIPSGPLISRLKQGKDISYKGKKYKSKNLTYVEKGKKISFVLDTGMNKKIVSFVKDSDLLICESSFGEDMKSFAKERFHLTAKQTGEIAKKSKSKRLILIHISQRYERDMKSILNQAKKEFKNVSIVDDLDEIEVK